MICQVSKISNYCSLLSIGSREWVNKGVISHGTSSLRTTLKAETTSLCLQTHCCLKVTLTVIQLHEHKVMSNICVFVCMCVCVCTSCSHRLRRRWYSHSESQETDTRNSNRLMTPWMRLEDFYKCDDAFFCIFAIFFRNFCLVQTVIDNK